MTTAKARIVVRPIDGGTIRSGPITRETAALVLSTIPALIAKEHPDHIATIYNPVTHEVLTTPEITETAAGFRIAAPTRVGWLEDVDDSNVVEIPVSRRTPWEQYIESPQAIADARRWIDANKDQPDLLVVDDLDGISDSDSVLLYLSNASIDELDRSYEEWTP